MPSYPELLAQGRDGNLCGTTSAGGTSNMGPIFKITAWGSAGQTVEIFGTGLTGASAVKFGSASATFRVVSDTYMSAVVRADGSTGFVTVTQPSGTLSSSRKFNVVPLISAISSISGRVATEVTTSGSGFTGTKKVAFNGVKAASYAVKPRSRADCGFCDCPRTAAILRRVPQQHRFALW